jgi:hypothetical protein
LESIFLVFVGCVAGFTVCAKVGTFFALLVKERRAVVTSHQLRPRVYAVLALHSGPWLVLGTVIFLVLFARANNPPPWVHTFFLGFCAAPVLYASLFAFVLLRNKAKRAHNSQA